MSAGPGREGERGLRGIARPAIFEAPTGDLLMDNAKMQLSDAEKSLRDAAFEYHRAPTFGKISVTPTKALSNQRDLSLAYSPGVAYPCLAIEADPSMAAEYTSRGNLVGVVTNGTAVLGLGDSGPLSSK